MISIISIEDRTKWDDIVQGFNDYDVYYLSGYVKAFQLHGDGEPVLIYYEGNDLKAINVVMKRDISNHPDFENEFDQNSLYDVSTPYGYGGFLLEGSISDNTLKSLNTEYGQLCSDEHIVSEFVRMHPTLQNSLYLKDIYDVTDLGSTITMELHSPKQIWKDLTSKNRNVIRKAKKSGVKVYWGRTPDLIDEFIPLYNATMDKEDATNYYYFNEDFYQSVLNDLRYNSMIFAATLDDQIISASIIMFANGKMHYHLSASDQNYRNLASSNLLLYEAACWGCNNGYRAFHLGGGLGSEEDSLYKFKQAFNKNSNTNFSIGKRIFDQEAYDKLVDIRKTSGTFDSENTFFPAYRQ